METNTPTSMGKAKWAVISVVVAAVAVAAGWYLVGPKVSGSVLGANTSYQAVFLTNGQVYFGKLSVSKDWVELTDIYYLQVTQNLQQASTDASKTPTSTGTANPQNNIQLVKLGSELHGPTDAMHIDRDKILFWEDMKDDSKVVQAIHQYQAK